MRRRQPKHRAEPAQRRVRKPWKLASVATLAASLAAAHQLTALPPADATPMTAGVGSVPAQLKSARLNVTLVLLQTRDKTAADVATLDSNAYVNALRSTGAYWSSMSSGRLSVDVGRIIARQQTAAASWDDFTVILDTVTREMGWTPSPGQVLVLAIPRDDLVVYGKGGNLGAGWESGPNTGRILLARQSAFSGPVATHEMGHVLGLGHANTLQCSNGARDAVRQPGRFSDPACSTRAYGDRTDIMGAAQYSQPHLNAYLSEYGGIGNDGEITDAGTAGAPVRFTLWPWGGTGPARAVKFRDPATGEWYYLQYKAPVGYDAPTAVDGNRGVEIIKAGLDADESLLIPPSTIPFAGYYASTLAWQQNQTFLTAGNAMVRVDSIQGANATVTISAADSSGSGLQAQLDAKAAEHGLGPAFGGLGTTRDGGRFHMYQGGAVVWTPSGGAHVSRGAIRDAWNQQGFENGRLGYPTTDEVGGLRDGGAFQMYEGGAIVWSPGSGAHVSWGAIRGAWQRKGFENGPLGYPTTDEVGGLLNGGAYQMYEGGAVIWSPTTGAHESRGAIRGTWQRRGFENGPLGYPTTDEVGGLRNGGAYQMYEGGAVIWSPAIGAHESRGAIRTAYAAAGYQDGTLGYPTSDEYAFNGGFAQDYQGGRITWSNSLGTRVETKAAPAPTPTTPVLGGASQTPSSPPGTVAQIQSMVRDTAVRMGVDPALALAIAEQESGFRQNVVSPAGAIGVMQIMPANRDWLAGLTGRPSLNLQNASDNVTAGVALIRWLLSQAANRDQAIAGYYQGLYSVKSRGMYQDTKAYVAQVTARMPKYA